MSDEAPTFEGFSPPKTFSSQVLCQKVHACMHTKFIIV